MQLIDRASLVLLERQLRAAGREVETLYDPSADWDAFGPYLDAWIGEAARGIAHAIAAATAIIDFEAAVIDGAVPPRVRTRLLAAVAEALDRLDLLGDHRAGAAPRQHRRDRPGARRREPAALRPLPARPERHRRTRKSGSAPPALADGAEKRDASLTGGQRSVWKAMLSSRWLPPVTAAM